MNALVTLPKSPNAVQQELLLLLVLLLFLAMVMLTILVLLWFHCTWRAEIAPRSSRQNWWGIVAPHQCHLDEWFWLPSTNKLSASAWDKGATSRWEHLWGTWVPMTEEICATVPQWKTFWTWRSCAVERHECKVPEVVSTGNRWCQQQLLEADLFSPNHRRNATVHWGRMHGVDQSRRLAPSRTDSAAKSKRICIPSC